MLKFASSLLFLVRTTSLYVLAIANGPTNSMLQLVEARLYNKSG